MGKHLLYVSLAICAAVLFTAKNAMANDFTVPTLDDRGMLAVALLLGLVGAYRILKQKR
jgi:hypothetical protein